MKFVFYFIITLLLFSQKTFSQKIDDVVTYPYSSKFDTLFVIYDEDFSEDELFTIEVLQGQLAKEKPKIFRDIGTGSSIWINDLKENYNIHTDYNYSGNFNALLSKFQTNIDGYLLYDDNTVNEAITLCGLLNTIPIKEYQINDIKNLDIEFIDDAKKFFN